jgi:hypothetical protein
MVNWFLVRLKGKFYKFSWDSLFSAEVCEVKGGRVVCKKEKVKVLKKNG